MIASPSVLGARHVSEIHMVFDSACHGLWAEYAALRIVTRLTVAADSGDTHEPWMLPASFDTST